MKSSSMANRHLAAIVAFSIIACFSAPAARADVDAGNDIRVDVCVYGGTSSGVVAACTVAKAGKSVILVEPARHLGGLSSGGLGETDIGNKMAIGGMSREFYRQTGKAYGKDEAWKFEPHVAENVFNDFIAQNKVRVLFEHQLLDAQKTGTRITQIRVANVPADEANCPVPVPQDRAIAVKTITAAMFIDATYEGDLIAAARVGYAVGRESSAQYDEPLNGVRDRTPSHQFLVPVDPYVKPGDPTSGLLPFIQSTPGAKPGDADKCVQSYNFRLCFTQNPALKIDIKPPADYDPQRYELLARNVEGLLSHGWVVRVTQRQTPGFTAPKLPAPPPGKKKVEIMPLFKLDLMPNDKTDINNHGAVSTDFIGQNYAYPDGDRATRNKIWHQHLNWIQGLVYYIQTSDRIPQSIRAEMKTWGLCKDEFKDTAGWPHQMYVREARRMIGRYVVTQADCMHKNTAEDSIGMAAYNMDSHNCQRLVQAGVVRNEGDVQVAPSGPYPISYRAITPKSEECENLVVPVCVSASHIAYGSIRMEPVFMVLGESAAVAACDAIDQKKSVQEIDIPKLQQQLRDAKQVLYYKK